jgi:hypothetical protein
MVSARRAVLSLAVLAAAGGCSARLGDPSTEGAQDSVDAGAEPDPPQPVPDAGPTAVDLTQNSNPEITPGTSIACVENDPNTGAAVRHKENRYFRVFDLAAAGVTGDLAIDKVSFGIEQATSPAGSQAAGVRLHTLTGDLELANLAQIATADVTVPDPAGSTLVVEIYIPDAGTDASLLFIGANTDGQTGPTYLQATDCGLGEPTDLATAGYPDVAIVLSASGSYE